MRQNPFSLYDFLGYVFPGALAIIIICFFHQLTNLSSINNNFVDGMAFIESQTKRGSLEIIEDTIILTIVSYVVGHIIAYLSSITVEQYAQWLFGFPSFFLLNKSPNWLYWRLGQNRQGGDFKWPENNMDWWILVVRGIVGLLLFPITICYLIFGKLLGMKDYFVKPLDITLKNAIKTNSDNLARSLGISKRDNDDFHRVIYHYEYEHQNHHVQKMDNYVALYGFLRALTFIMVCTSLWIAYKYIIPTFNFNASIDWALVRLLVASIILTYICFMGFMKFYRRFTLETLMCLVIDSSFKTIAIIPNTFSYVSGSTSNDTTVIEPSPATTFSVGNESSQPE